MMEIIEKQVEELIPYENNPRINNHAVEKVANSIREFGFKIPIVIDKDNVIVAGHTRLKAAKTLKRKTVPCIVADDLSEEQIKAFRLADNKTGELAYWDFDILSEELNDILDVDMSNFGFEEITDCETETIEDDYEIKVPPTPKAKKGEIYKLGRHRLMCEDSTNAEDVEILMNGNKADMLLTDPPYNVALGMGGSYDEARKRHRRTDGLVIMNDNMSDNAFRIFLASCFSNAKENMKPGASFYIWHADNGGDIFRISAKDAGLTLRQTLIWVKNRFTLGRQDYQWQHEPYYT